MRSMLIPLDCEDKLNIMVSSKMILRYGKKQTNLVGRYMSFDWSPLRASTFDKQCWTQ